LYVSDLDGTLLGPDSLLSGESSRLLNRVISLGGLFTYATARSFSSSRRATAALDLQLPVITYGGTITADPDDGRPTRLRLLDQDVVGHIRRSCAARIDTEPIWHTYENGQDWLRWRPERRTAGIDAFVDARRGDRRLRPITDDDPLDPTSVFYVAVLAPRPSLIPLQQAMSRLPDQPAAFLSDDPGTPGLAWFEVHDAMGTKAHAIRDLAESIMADRIVVFGNNHNDLPMFEIADERIAVEDAIPELKAAATTVIGNSMTNAVAQWILADHLDRSSDHTTGSPTRTASR